LSDQAFVLWLDMLGYKNWLLKQSDLVVAESKLLEAIKVGFQELAAASDFPAADNEIQSLLISDTIVIWSHKNDPNVIAVLAILYHFLFCRLSKLGLPVRGALVRGSLRVRIEPPSILLGEAVVECATIEPKLNAFVVAVHSSIIEFLNEHAVTSEEREVQGFFSNQDINTKNGNIQMPVISWGMPFVAESLLGSYKLLIDRLRSKDDSVFPELDAFLPKLINSKDMIETTFEGMDDCKRVRDLWSVALDHAAELLEARTIAKRG